MPTTNRLDAAALYRRCDPQNFTFKTTAELEEFDEIVGQPRAVEAIEFGLDIKREGFNLFAFGPIGTGKQSLVRHAIEHRAGTEPPPNDWCYLYNFTHPHQPRALRLPAGEGVKLRQAMSELVEALRGGLVAAFESDEYRSRRQLIGEAFEKRQQGAFEKLQGEARARGLALARNQEGFFIAFLQGDEVVATAALDRLPPEQRERLLTERETLQEHLEQLLHRIPRWEQEMQQQLRELEQEVSGTVITPLLRELQERYAALPAVVEYLQAVEADAIEHARELLDPGQTPPDQQGWGAGEESPFKRYQVNVLVDHGESKSRPVIYEVNPTLQNLIGRVEHLPRMGALLTDFTLIKAGALHRANGGYLILDGRNILGDPHAWQALKRALQSGEIRIELPSPSQGPMSTISLEPEPIPLQIKVALLGERSLYYWLMENDPEARELFKVAADFSDEMERTPENEQRYARLIGTLARRQGLRPLTPDGVARTIEQSARLAGNAEKLSTQMRGMMDLLTEADYWAGEAGREVIQAIDVQRAIDAQLYRADRPREQAQERILHETILIDTEGSHVGQVNGLAVLGIGNFSFGRPSRITARVRLGRGEVLDIEREVELGGPLHSKGVLILTGFLGARYSAEAPLSLAATLVFEQSYNGVDGDSASSAELYALLSAIAALPIKQSLAVTGAVNQHGRVQAIGGVNEKIEGFFDICKARGLTGEQGVLIPAANVRHLMLRQDVVAAVAKGQFHIYAIETVDEGIELLTGLPAGQADEQGRYPSESVNGRVAAALARLAEKRREWEASINQQRPNQE